MSPFDHDVFDNSDVFDQKVPVAPPSRLLDRYGARACGAEDVLDDAQPPKAFVPSAPLALHADDESDPAIGTSPFDHDGDYGFDNFDVFDQKVAVAVAPPSRLLDRYGAPTLDAEDVLDDAQPPKAFVPSAPLAFHADDESDGEDRDAGSHAAQAVRKAEYSSDDDSEEEEEEEEDAEYDLSETESVQSRSSDEELDMDGSSSDDDNDDDEDDEEQVFPEAWSDGDDE